jgi:hypothetical protein
MFTAGNTNGGVRLSIIDFVIKVGCCVKKVNDIFNIKGADINWLSQGGQLY